MRRKIVSIFLSLSLFLSILSLPTHADSDTDIGVATDITSDMFDFWVVNSLKTVYRTSTIPAKPDKNITLVSAKNEYESAIIAVRNKEAFEITKVEFSDLVSASNENEKISGSNLAYHFVEYGLTDTIKANYIFPEREGRLIYPESEMPDPLTNEVSMQVKANSTQPIFITNYVPTSTAPGTYTGTVNVKTSLGDYIVPIRVEVANVEIPKTKEANFINYQWSMTNGFGSDGYQFGPEVNEKGYDVGEYYYDVVTYSEEWFELMKNYAKTMSEYRQNMIWIRTDLLLNATGTDLIAFKDGIPNDIDWSLFDRYVETFIDQGITDFANIHLIRQLKYMPGDENPGAKRWEEGLPEELPVTDAFLTNYLTALSKHVQEKQETQEKWKGLTWYQHILDEPITDNQKNFWTYVARKIHEINTNLTIKFKTMDADPNGILMAEGSKSYVDVWVPLTPAFHKKKELYKAEQLVGKDMWVYTCEVNTPPWLNRFWTQPTLTGRLLFWNLSQDGVQGALHWAWNAWYVGPWDGDSSIVYPDKDHMGVKSSLRYEAQRDGIEDYELMFKIKETNKELAKLIADSAVSPDDPRKYTLDPEYIKTLHDYLVKAAAGENVGEISFATSPYSGQEIPMTYMADSSNSDLKFTGNWYNKSRQYAYQDSVKSTTAANAAVEYQFRGTGIDLVVEKNNGAGKMAVYLDQNDPVILDAYELVQHDYITIYSIRNLSQDQQHTIKVVNLENKNLNIDAFRVQMDEGQLLTLIQTYNEALKKNKNDYTEQSWSQLAVAMYRAKNLIDGNSNDEAAMTAATNALTQAMGGLVKNPNYALGAKVTASEAYKDDNYDLKAEYAVDGDKSTWWATKNDCDSATYELVLKNDAKINRLVLYEYGIYNNLKTVTVEYKSGSNWTAVSNAKKPVYSGQSRTVVFDEVTASEFRLTLTTVNPGEGLNFSEIQLWYVMPIAVQATATNSDDSNPASNLVDEDPATAWLSDGSEKQSVIEIDYGVAKIVNTITVDEAKQTTGKLKTIQVDYWDGAEWKTLKTEDCVKLPYKKNIFFESVITSKIRLTVKTDTNGAMKINEVTALEYAAADMPLDTGLIELEPNVVPNEHQKTMVDRGYTMFLHFGLNTFTENEWSYGDLSPATYAPPSIDADQWVKTAKEAGMKTVLLVTKHHDGFALWDSAYTDYDVGNPQSGSHIDVVQAVSDACNKYGINMGVYYSAWDNNWDRKNGKENDAKYNEYARNQLSELMSGKYGLKDENGRGVISELWIDGQWEKAAPRWEFGKLYDTVKELQPDCQVGLNWTIASTDGKVIGIPDHKEGDNIYYFPSDFRLGDGMETSDNDPKLFTYRGQTYYLPFEATLVLNSSWFWHTGYGSRPSMSPYTIAAKYNKYKNEGNVLVLNCGPNRQGKLDQADIDSLYAAARKLGIASGDALKKNIMDLEAKIYGRNLALNATGTSDQTYTELAVYGVEKMFDGDSSTRWASRGGDTESTAKITLAGEKTFNTLVLTEDSKYIGRTDSVTIQYEKDGQWIDIQTNAKLQNGILTVALETPLTATQLKLIAIDEQKTGPTFSEFALYMVENGALPEIEAAAEKSALRVGESTQLVVQDSVDKVDLMKIAKFESKDSTVATVDDTGKITAVAVGETDITVKVQLVGRTFTKQVHLTVTNSYEIKVTQAEGGVISPANVKVDKGDSATFTIKANNGYFINDVLVDGKSVGAVTSYTFNNVSENHTITAVFAKGKKPAATRYEIKVIHAKGGIISPANVKVGKGGNATFTIKTKDGYVINDVLADGKSVGAVTSYTFNNVSENHTITAVFVRARS